VPREGSRQHHVGQIRTSRQEHEDERREDDREPEVT
jgi:hypothetical protein